MMIKQTDPISLLAAQRLSPEEFRTMLSRKGWRQVDVAVRWDISPENLNRHIANPKRDIKWDALLKVLPRLSRQERLTIRQLRHAMRPSPKRDRAAELARAKERARVKEAVMHAKALNPLAPLASFYEPPPPLNGLRWEFLEIGDILVLLDDCLLGEEGDHLVVQGRKFGEDESLGGFESYLLAGINNKQAWFDPKDMDQYVFETGYHRSKNPFGIPCE